MNSISVYHNKIYVIQIKQKEDIMIKKLVRVLCIILAISELFSIRINSYSVSDAEKLENELLRNDILNYIEDIPVFIVDVRDKCLYERDCEELRFHKYVMNSIKNKLDYNKNFENSEYSILRINTNEIQNFVDKRILKDTINKVKSIKGEGLRVNYVTFLGNKEFSYSKENDPSWWESYYKNFGYYGGYKFLYSESSINYSGNSIDLLNNSRSKTWNNIFSSFIELGIDEIVDRYVNRTLKTVIDLFSSIFNREYPRIDISVRNAEGYIDASPHPTVRIRYVYIEDKLDKIPGHAYYEYGRTQMIDLSTDIYYKLPYRKRPGGWTYDYITGSKEFRNVFKNSGFEGPLDFLRSVKRYYENGTNSIYEENLDWHGLFMEFISK